MISEDGSLISWEKEIRGLIGTSEAEQTSTAMDDGWSFEWKTVVRRKKG